MSSRESPADSLSNVLGGLVGILIALLCASFLFAGAFIGALCLAHGGTASRAHDHSVIASVTGIDVTGATVVFDEDTHGGFQGEGEAYVVLSFGDDRALDTIQSNPAWTPLPLSENLALLAYGHVTNAGIRRVPLTWRMLDAEAEDTPLFPSCDDGYYLFIDRHSESTDRHSDAELFNRSSRNYTLALYVPSERRLYYFEYDS